MDTKNKATCEWQGHEGTEAKVRGWYTGRGKSTHKELTSVGVWSGVRHAEKKRAVVLQCKVLISELFPVNATPASSVSLLKVATLRHKVLDDAMKTRALVVQSLAFLVRKAAAETCKVGRGPRCGVPSEFEDDASQHLAFERDLEEHVSPVVR
jgi:hypothetical protein